MIRRRRRMSYMPWFHSSFLASTQGWTLEERGAYFMLLGAQWESGPLSTDLNRLAGIVNVSSAKFRVLWETIGGKFNSTASGLINDRLEEHRTKSLWLSSRRRFGAAKTNGTLKVGNSASSLEGEA
jgi:uncharacterized protein YdaU (DUF1376 family)